MNHLAEILQRTQAGDPQAAEQLLPLVYDELRKLAAAKLAAQSPGQTLQPTALVHEAWLKVSSDEEARWHDRQHFFRSAAQAMRQILVDRARSKKTDKRGNAPARVNWSELDIATNAEPDVLLLVDEAMQRLEVEHPDRAELVKLRFYTGFTIEETADALGVSEKTVKRQWTHARALLFHEINRLREKS
jgi:RNA polymerase sigma factor (TIGR02999 family)